MSAGQVTVSQCQDPLPVTMVVITVGDSVLVTVAIR